MATAEVERFLRASGKRLTAPRRLIIQIIEDNPHLDASEIYALARKEDPKISLSTVYRTMAMLKELKLVEASDLGEDHHHYEVHLKKHYHLICLGCGKVIEAPLPDAIKQLGKEQGFKVVGVKLEVFGYCKECQKKCLSRKKSKARKVKRASRLVDLRGVPLLKHPGVVSREMARANAGDLLEIITDEPGRLEMAPKMLEGIEGLQIVDIWQEGRIRHALVRKVKTC